MGGHGRDISVDTHAHTHGHEQGSAQSNQGSCQSRTLDWQGLFGAAVRFERKVR